MNRKSIEATVLPYFENGKNSQVSIVYTKIAKHCNNLSAILTDKPTRMSRVRDGLVFLKVRTEQNFLIQIADKKNLN